MITKIPKVLSEFKIRNEFLRKIVNNNLFVYFLNLFMVKKNIFGNIILKTIDFEVKVNFKILLKNKMQI